MNWESFHKAYSAADEAKKGLIDSSTIPDCVEKVLVGQNLNPAHRQVLVQLVAYHSLGIATAEQAEVELKKHAVADAGRIFSTITNCVKNASPSTPPAPTPTSSTGSVAAPVPTPPPSPAQPTPAVPQTVPTIRTMQGDMTQQSQARPQENVYSSTQEAILKEVTPKPKGEVPPPPPQRAV